MGLLTRWDELHGRLLQNIVGGRTLHRDTVNYVHEVFISVRECFDAAARVVSHLPADANADSSEHPLFAYARRTAAGVLTWCVPLTLNMLGHPASMKVDGRKLVFTAELDITRDDPLSEASSWDTEAAIAWWNDRDARMQCYAKWVRVIDSLPDECARLH
jgi:hypothetical protein